MAVDSQEDSLFPDLDQTIGKTGKKSPSLAPISRRQEPELDEETLQTLTKAELVERLTEVLGLSDTLCRELVISFFDRIKSTLIAGEDVKIAGLGSFYIRQKSARPGRNPKTGEEVTITPRKAISFKPSRLLRQRIEEAHADKA